MKSIYELHGLLKGADGSIFAAIKDVIESKGVWVGNLPYSEYANRISLLGAVPFAAAVVPIADTGDSAVTFTWASAANAVSYDLLWSTEPGVSLASNMIQNITSPYVHSGLINDQPYYYKIVSRNLGDYPTLSDELEAIPGISYSTGDTVWDFSLSSSVTIRDVVTDSAGNVYACGTVTASTSFGSIPASAGSFIGKMDSDGVWQWVTVADSGNNHMYGVAADALGNVYGVGYFSGVNVFGGTQYVSNNLSGNYSQDCCVWKLSATDGSWLGVYTGYIVGVAPNPGYVYPSDICVDSANNVFLVGTYSRGTLYFGATGGLPSEGYCTNGFVVKLNASGTYAWAKWITNAPNLSTPVGISQVDTDSSGDAYLSGFFGATTYFNTSGPTLVASGSYDGFLAKISSSGAWLWASQISTNNEDRAPAVVVDYNNSVFVAGQYYGAASVGTLSLPYVGDRDSYVAKVSSDGTWLWAKNMNSSTRDIATGLCVDASNNIYTLGKFSGTINFDGSISAITAPVDYSAYIVQMNNNGDWLWARTFNMVGDINGGDVRGVIDSFNDLILMQYERQRIVKMAL